MTSPSEQLDELIELLRANLAAAQETRRLLLQTTASRRAKSRAPSTEAFAAAAKALRRAGCLER